MAQNHANQPLLANYPQPPPPPQQYPSNQINPIISQFPKAKPSTATKVKSSRQEQGRTASSTSLFPSPPRPASSATVRPQTSKSECRAEWPGSGVWGYSFSVGFSAACLSAWRTVRTRRWSVWIVTVWNRPGSPTAAADPAYSYRIVSIIRSPALPRPPITWVAS